MEATWSLAPTGVLDPVPRPQMNGVHVGTLAQVSADDGICVTYAGQPAYDPLSARSTVRLAPEHEGRSVVLAFEGGDPHQPIVMGLVEEHPVQAEPPVPQRTVHLDGREVCIAAEAELELRCGKSSIKLSADGRIVIRGMEVVSRARQTNKVQGATVRIN